MKPVFNQPLDGLCVRASIASLFEIPMDKAPMTQCEGHHFDEATKSFICSKPEHLQTYDIGNGKTNTRYTCDSVIEQDERINQWAAEYGLKFVKMRMEYWGGQTGPDSNSPYKVLPLGICMATGKSPRGNFDHAVVWDTRLTDFEHPYGRMIHDPYPAPEGERPGLLYVEQFEWFEVVDPALLANLHRLRE